MARPRIILISICGYHDCTAYPHGRERWYITRFFDDLSYQPDAISQDDLYVYARGRQLGAGRRPAANVSSRC
jgi:hypothetical protein